MGVARDCGLIRRLVNTKPNSSSWISWDNFAYFQLNPQGELLNPETPLPVRLFRLRVGETDDATWLE